MLDRKETVIGVSFSMPILAVLAVLARIYVKRMRKVKLGADDYTVFLGLIFSIGVCLCVLIAAFVSNLGGHTTIGANGLPIIKPGPYIVFQKMIWVIQVFSALGPGFTKISVCLFYKTIFAIGTKSRFMINLLITMSSLWLISLFFANFLNCVPLSENWAITFGHPHHCLDIKKLFNGHSITDIVTDVLILVFPWYPVWNLHIPIRKKLLVCGIFLLGGFVVLAGILRYVYILDAASSHESALDYTYTEAPALYWGAIETCVGVICACLPTLGPLFAGFSPESLIRSFEAGLTRILSRTKLSSTKLSSEVELSEKASSKNMRPSESQSLHHPVQTDWNFSNQTSVNITTMQQFAENEREIALEKSFVQHTDIV